MNAIKHWVYCTACVLFTIIVGAAVYEHVCVWPKAWSAPPASLTMFQGEFGMNNGEFWQRIHPVALLFMILSTVLFWKSERRVYLFAALAGYLVVMVWTFIYFVPELLAILGTEYTNTVDDTLVARASRWETLSLVRLAIIALISFVLLTGLSKSVSRPSAA